MDRDGRRERGQRVLGCPTKRSSAAAPTSASTSSARPSDLLFMYTGGTTGMPKGVMWEHAALYRALGGGGNAVLGEKASESVEEQRDRVAQEAPRPAPAAGLPADARHGSLHCDQRARRRRRDHHAHREEPRRRRAVVDGRSARRDRVGDRRRCLREADAEGAAGEPRAAGISRSSCSSSRPA